MTELKPCPFCGGEAILCETGDSLLMRSMHYIECQQCLMRTVDLLAKVSVISLWNTRQPQGINWQPIEELEMGTFKHVLLNWQRKGIICIGYIEDSNIIDIVCFDSDLSLNLSINKKEFTRFAELTPPKE